ncbi:MAG: hypothetical protein P1U56_23960 [Saprospiraceae bacterium]|nr:hypothetical protein [Saprospiraceae bacterium]
MKNIFFTFLSFLLALNVSAQLINDGASIIVEDGATLFIEGSLQNNLTGSIDIQGTGIVEVEGDVTIAPTSTVTMANTAKLILSGSNAANVTSGGATFSNVEMDKTANNVTLLDQMRISTDLNFLGDNNKLILGDNNLVFTPSATITSADANEYIIADGNANTGVVSKELSANEVFKFEIGDATNYTPLDADITGTGFSSATVNVNVVPMVQPNAPAEATDFISRYWNVDETGVTDFSADLTGTYVVGDLTGTAGDVKGAHYGSTLMDWTYDAAAAGTNSAIGTVTESGDFTGTNTFGRVDMKVFLHGAFSSGTSELTNLLSLETDALTSPYDPTVTVDASIFTTNTDIVDWVELELRSSSAAVDIISSHSAFVKQDGSIVGLDGVSLPYLKNAPASAFTVIRHRNHLAIMTDATINLTGSIPTLNFTDNSAGTFGANAQYDLGGGFFGMIAGDANEDGTVNAVDKNSFWRVQNGAAYNYLTSTADFNMDGTVNAVDKNSYWRLTNSLLSNVPN